MELFFWRTLHVAANFKSNHYAWGEKEVVLGRPWSNFDTHFTPAVEIITREDLWVECI